MRTLEYRSPRLAMDFCVDFVTGTALFRGTCVDVNGEGLRASFDLPVPKSLVGSLILHHPLCRASIPARVVYLLKDQVGFVFFDHTRRDQDVLFHFMGIVGIQ